MNADVFGSNAQLAFDTLNMKSCHGIPSWIFHTMDIPYMEHTTGNPEGAYKEDPDRVYIAFQQKVGTCLLDQYLADNPLSLGEYGFNPDSIRGATTGIKDLVLDGITINSPESVIEHLERVVFPGLEKQIQEKDPDDEQSWLPVVRAEKKLQCCLGNNILKAPYGESFNGFPILRYQIYGYENYLSAYALYPDVMERDFCLQSQLAEKMNLLAVRAIQKGPLPTVLRIDHDMAGSKGMLVKIQTLDKIWFPYFERAIKPYIDAGIRLVWHCDGNLMEMIPRLIEVGIGGFQGFQYEDGMQYEQICQMSTRDGDPLMIWGGVSVSTTLPFGSPDDIRKELKWLVSNAPPVGFFLGASSTIVPGVRWENLDTLAQGLAFYRENGRSI